MKERERGIAGLLGELGEGEKGQGLIDGRVG